MLNKITIHHKQKILIIHIILVVLILAVFRQVSQFDFVNIDDGTYVTENSHVLSGITLEGIHWAFSTTYAEFWHPLTWISLMLDHQLYGLNAGAYHTTNLTLHILSTLLLFWLFNRMTGTPWRSAFVAALFGIHPLHVESVVWIAERKDVLSGFFWMLTLCLYVYYTEKQTIKRYGLVLCSFVLALLSKPMVITLPVIMILLDYWPIKRFKLQKGNVILWQVKEKFPFFILSATFSIITIYARYKPYGKDFQSPFSSYIANAAVAFLKYVEKTFWPQDMAFFYPFSAQISIGYLCVSLLLIITISVFVLVMVQQQPYLFVGWLWYAVSILPVIGIVRVGDFSMADRYHYLPSIGLAVMLAWGIPALIKREEIKKKILFPAGIIFIVIMALLAHRQCGYWQNSISLLRHTLQVTQNNYLAHNNMGLALFNQGKIEEAMKHYNESIRLKPYYAYAHNNRGIVYGELRQYQLAMNDFNEAIRKLPFYADAYYNRGVTYDKLGQHQNAIDDYNQAIRLKPDYTKAYINRGIAYLKKRDKTLGCSDVGKACALGDCEAIKTAQRLGLCR